MYGESIWANQSSAVASAAMSPALTKTPSWRMSGSSEKKSSENPSTVVSALASSGRSSRRTFSA